MTTTPPATPARLPPPSSSQSLLPNAWRRLLIVKLSSIGDIVHALPVATTLRRSNPQARITWAVENWTAPLVRGHPAIDRVVELPHMRWGAAGPRWLQAFGRAMRVLREERYDVCLDLQGLLKSSVVALLSRSHVRLGLSGQREGAWLVSRPIRTGGAQQHVVDTYLSAAVHVGAARESTIRFDLPVDAAASRSIAHRLETLGISAEVPLIVVNPTSSARWKDWPLPSWARVVGALTDAGAVLLVGAGAHVPRHAAILKAATECGASRRLHDLTGETTLAELVAVLDRCTVHVAPDTGSAHIAAALGRPVVGVYGPTTPWRQGPYGSTQLAVHHPGLCGATCPRLCLRRRVCLHAIEPAEVVARTRQVLER